MKSQSHDFLVGKRLRADQIWTFLYVTLLHVMRFVYATKNRLARYWTQTTHIIHHAVGSMWVNLCVVCVLGNELYRKRNKSLQVKSPALFLQQKYLTGSSIWKHSISLQFSHIVASHISQHQPIFKCSHLLYIFRSLTAKWTTKLMSIHISYVYRLSNKSCANVANIKLLTQ